MFYGLVDLLRERGHEVRTFVRRSADLPAGAVGQVRGFLSGIWSFRARRALEEELDEHRPDIVQIQNLFPLISPSVLGAVRMRRLPLVMMCQNYRLFCPTGLMLRDGRPCSDCVVGGESQCVRHRCEGGLGRSVGYALRNKVARSRLLRWVDRFVVLSSFQRDRFVQWGVPMERIRVVPNFVDVAAGGGGAAPDAGAGSVGGYVGRLSREKGLEPLLEAARACPEIPFEFAGHAAAMPGIESTAPANVRFLGELRHDEVPGFLARCRFTAAPSIWYEGMPFVVLEAMRASRPVVASRIGGLADMIEDGRSGLLVAPGDSEGLARAFRRLWRDPEACSRMGAAARDRVHREYGRDVYYERMVSVYRETVKEVQP
ncbi:glycosyltransferase [Opitutales bacterium ASA1]|nr:glycosyltransferase [Opitutales bacterium ASA1]